MPAARIGAVALVAACLLLVGCGSNGTTATSTSPSASPAASQAPAPTPAPRTLRFKLNACKVLCDPMHEGASKFGRGTVQVDINNDGYTIAVTVTGLTPNTTHLINTHPGTCAAPDLSLQSFIQIAVAKADAKGTFTSVTPRPGAWFVPGAGLIMTVHGDSPNRHETHIACANLTN